MDIEDAGIELLEGANQFLKKLFIPNWKLTRYSGPRMLRMEIYENSVQAWFKCTPVYSP